MTRNISFICAMFMGLALTGCAYFDPPPAQTEAPVAVVESRPLNQPLKVEDIISSSTDGRVQVFSFDEPVASQHRQPVPEMQAMAEVVPPARADGLGPVEVGAVEAVPVGQSLPVSMGDPSVQVFPLDDGAMPAPHAPKLMPPSQAWKPYPSPFTKKKTPLDPGTGKSVIYFGHNASELTADHLQTLNQVAHDLKEENVQGVFVDGYASSQSSVTDVAKRKAVNLKISLARAYSVSRVLIGLGIPAEIIETRGFGEDGDDDNARRVEITGLPGQ